MLHLPTLTTARLLLRPFVLGDAAQVHPLVSDYEIYRTTSNIPRPYDEGYAERWIATHADQFYTNQHVTLAITDAANSNILGAISLGTNRTHQRAELGYWVGVPYWGKGYGSEAAQAIIRYGFEVLDLHKIMARHMAGNPASGRIMQKAGMQQEAVLREDILKDGVYHDVVVYGLINPAHPPQTVPAPVPHHAANPPYLPAPPTRAPALR